MKMKREEREGNLGNREERQKQRDQQLGDKCRERERERAMIQFDMIQFSLFQFICTISIYIVKFIKTMFWKLKNTKTKMRLDKMIKLKPD